MRSDRLQHQQELAAAGLDLGCHREIWREPGQPIDQPPARFLGIRTAWAAAHHLAAALAVQPFDARHDRRGVDDEQVRRPGHDGPDRALTRVARPVRKALGPRGCLLALRPGATVEAGAKAGVDRSVGIDRLIAKPTAPVIALTNLAQGAHDQDATAIGNVLTRALRWPAADVADQLDDLHAILGPSLIMAPAWLRRAATLAHTHALSFYDASSAAAAVELGMPLISADHRLLTAGLAESPAEITTRLRLSLG